MLNSIYIHSVLKKQTFSLKAGTDLPAIAALRRWQAGIPEGSSVKVCFFGRAGGGVLGVGGLLRN